MTVNEFETHCKAIQEILIDYSTHYQIGTGHMEQILAAMFCTIAARNGRTIEYVLQEVNEEYEVCMLAVEELVKEREKKL